MSALDPAGPGASSIAGVWWVMFWASMAILFGVTALGLYAALSRPERRPRLSTRTFVIGGGIVFPTVVLAALLAYGVRAGHALLPLPRPEPVLTIDVTAHQWWWEVAYPDGQGGKLLSANEIHIPAGRPVDIHLRTADVIHSFWVPRLAGKIDAIPGITNVIRLEASHPGLFRGQCAEFCGAQHARMGLWVEAHDEAEFERRLTALAGSGPPAVPDTDRGALAFEAACARCHSLRPELRSTEIGPNLADLPRRRALGADTIPYREGALQLWIAEHHLRKPGNPMPSFEHLDRETLSAIAEYLEAGR